MLGVGIPNFIECTDVGCLSVIATAFLHGDAKKRSLLEGKDGKHLSMAELRPELIRSKARFSSLCIHHYRLQAHACIKQKVGGFHTGSETRRLRRGRLKLRVRTSVCRTRLRSHSPLSASPKLPPGTRPR